jgi:uncharacterized protein
MFSFATSKQSRLAGILAMAVVCPIAGWAQAVKDLPKPTDYVSDDAHVLSAETIAHLGQVAGAVERQAHAQIAVVTVKNTDGEPIADYAVQLEDAWKVGAKASDRGVILLVSIGDRKIFISTGYGLEGVITDERSGMIARQMQQYLRVSQNDEGLTLGTEALAGVIAQDAGVQLQVRRAHLAPVDRGAHIGGVQKLITLGVLALLVLLAARTGMLPFLLGMFLGGGFGGGGGGGGGRDDDGDGFGGFGGGSTGGGGAGSNF